VMSGLWLFLVPPRAEAEKAPHRVLGLAAACVVAVRLVVHAHRWRQRGRARQQHEEYVTQWLMKQHQACVERAAEPTSSRAACSPEADIPRICRMWTAGLQLGIDANLLEDLQDLAIPTLKRRLAACTAAPVSRSPDLGRPRALTATIRQITELRLQGRMDHTNWATAVRQHRGAAVRGWRHLLRLLLLSSAPRALGVALTAGIAALGDKLCCESSNAFDMLTETMLLPSISTEAVVLKWMAIHIMYCIMEDAVEFVRCKVARYLTSTFRTTLDRTLYRSIAAMDMEFFDAHSPTELTALSQVGQQLEDADTQMQRTVGHVVGLLTRGVYLTRLSPRLMPPVAVISLLNIAWEATFTDAALRTEGGDAMRSPDPVAHSDGLPAILMSLRTLRCFGREHDAFREWAAEKEQKDQQAHPTGITMEVLQTAFSITAGYWRLLALWYCTQAIALNVADEPVPLTVYTFVTKVLALFQDMRTVDVLWVEECAVQASCYVRLVSHTPAIEVSGGLRPQTVRGELELRDVHFAYPSRPEAPVLAGLSLTIPPGDLLVLVGHSGAGKSTIMSLLMRFYDVGKGQILLDGVDIKEYDPRWLRTTIAHVSQEVQLFPMSVIENLRFGRPSATHAEVVEAAKQACAYHFIVRLPGGFNTIIGPHHYQLSGGQKQRLAIARALVMQAKILMLDEATSALDTWSQNHVCHTVQERLGCTCLFITTRMTAARNANHIAVVSHGRCEEEGTHEELLARGGLYARILSEEAEAGDGVSPVPEARDDHAPTDRVADPQVAALERVFSPFHAPPPATPLLPLLHSIHHDSRQILAVLDDLIHVAKARHRECPAALMLATGKLGSILERSEELMRNPHGPSPVSPRSFQPRSRTNSPPRSPTSTVGDVGDHWAMPPPPTSPPQRSHRPSRARSPALERDTKVKKVASFRQRPPPALESQWQCSPVSRPPHHWLGK